MKFNSGAHFFGFQSEMPFLGKFGSKSQNYLFELKSGTYTNSNMQISMEMFTFFLSDQKCPFWKNLVQNVKIVSLRLNLLTSIIRICRIQRWCSFFSFSIGNALLGQIWSKMTKLSV